MEFLKKVIRRLMVLSKPKPWLHDWCISAYYLFFPAPFQEDDMEFKLGVWAGISTIRCAEGRQIGETNSVPVEFQRDIPTHFYAGNLDGSRAGYSINLTALHHIMRLWLELLEVTTAIRSATIKHLKIQERPLTAIEVYLVAMVGVSVPAFLARKFPNPVLDGHVSSLVADQQKLITGVFMMVRHMLERGDERLNSDTHFTGAELYDYADREGLFLAPSGAKTACGGSKRKIIEFIDHIIHGADNNAADAASSKNLEVLCGIEDVDAFMAYALGGTEMELATMLARSGLRLHLLQTIKVGCAESDYKWIRIKKNLSNSVLSNSALTHQISVLANTLQSIKKRDECYAWLDLCMRPASLNLETYKDILVDLQAFYSGLQENLLLVLGRNIAPTILLDLESVNKKIGLVPNCVFKELFKS